MVHATKKGIEKISLASISTKQSKQKTKTREDYLRNLDTAVRIGKSGLTESVIEEIKRQLKKNKTIKIKILRPAITDTPKKELFQRIEKETEATILNSIGFTLILTKQKQSKQKQQK